MTAEELTGMLSNLDPDLPVVICTNWGTGEVKEVISAREYRKTSEHDNDDCIILDEAYNIFGAEF
jgi:hypothetical protein